MSDNIIDFPASTTEEIPVTTVLEGASEAKLRTVFVIGIDAETNELRLFTSTGERATLFGLCHMAVKILDDL